MPPFRIRIFELAEDVDRLLADDVGQHVQPAAMGHGHHHFDNAVVGGCFQGEIQQRNQRLGAFQRKRLGAQILLADEFFEDHGVGQPSEDSQLDIARRRFVELALLDSLLQPFAHVAVGDVHVIEADEAAIGFFQPINQFAQLHGLRRAAANGCNDVAIQIGGTEAVICRVDGRTIARRETERIELCCQVPERAVGIDKLVDALLADECRVVGSLRCF